MTTSENPNAMTNPPVVRFAPSPTGYLHIGNARPALFNWLYAKQNGGTFILRFDDTDLERSKQEFADAIERDLRWIGIEPDRMERQSSRFVQHDMAADKLIKAGKLYPCYETPEEIERRRKRLMARGKPPIYDRAALNLSDDDCREMERQGRKPHWRFLLPNFELDPFETRRTEVRWDDLVRGRQTVDLASISDPVLIRADGTYLYTLPSVVDDIDMGISHVIRGDDHITNTGAQIKIFEALEAEIPVFGHHNLLTTSDGEGLSKRMGSLSLSQLRNDGYEPMALACLASLIGTSLPVETHKDMASLVAAFDLKTVSKSAAKFDVRELSGLSEKLVHAMSYDEAKHRLAAVEADRGEAFWNAVRANISRVEEAADWIDVVYGDISTDRPEGADEVFVAQAAQLLPAEPFDETTWKSWTSELKEMTGRKGRALFMPLRLALTGRDHGPELAALLPLIGRARALDRLS
ncbi:MAG: glutamate--tRNA ligase [Pseudomonadota bacterium]